MKLTPSKKTIKLSLISATTTLAILIIEKIIGPTHTSIAFIINNEMIAESLNIQHSVPAIGIAMFPGLLAIIFAISLKSNEDKQKCLLKIDSPLDLENDTPESFPPNQWLNSPAGVRIFYWLSDLALIKVGVSVTSTVAGASIYLLLFKPTEWGTLLGVLLISYILSVFQNYLRWRLGKILLIEPKGPETISS